MCGRATARAGLEPVTRAVTRWAGIWRSHRASVTRRIEVSPEEPEMRWYYVSPLGTHVLARGLTPHEAPPTAPGGVVDATHGSRMTHYASLRNTIVDRLVKRPPPLSEAAHGRVPAISLSRSRFAAGPCSDRHGLVPAEKSSSRLKTPV